VVDCERRLHSVVEGLGWSGSKRTMFLFRSFPAPPREVGLSFLPLLRTRTDYGPNTFIHA
jgi:hypothetical protein